MDKIADLNILFLEDELIDQMAIERMAKENPLIKSYDICDTIKDGLKKLEENDYNVVVSDYKLNDGLGIEVVQSVKDLPVVVVTGMGDEALAVEAMKAGAVDYIVKDRYNAHLERVPIAIEKAYRDFLKNQKYLEAQRRYHDLFENSSDLIQSVDIQGNFIYVNPSWHAVLGYTEDDLEKINFFEIVHEDHFIHCKSVFDALQRGKSFKNEEVFFIAKDGQTIIAEGNLSCKFDSRGEAVAIRGIFRDVTQKKEAQLELRKSESKYRTLVESAHDIIYYGDPYGNLEFINKQGPVFTGYDHSDLDGIKFTKLIDPEYVPQVQAFYARQFKEKKKNSYMEFPIIKKDGKRFWVGQSVETIFEDGDSNKIAGYLGIVRDINEKKLMEEQLKMSNKVLEKRVSWRTKELETANRKLLEEIKLRVETEKALKKSEKEYKALFQNAHDAILIFDPDSEKVLEVNEQACKVYGYSRDEFIGLSLQSLSASTDGQSELIESTKEDKYNSFEVIQLNKSGSEMILEVYTTKVVYRGQKAVLSLNKDITVKREIEQKLKEERNRRLSALIDGQEMERKRLSRELHDGLGQLLTASIISLKQLEVTDSIDKAHGLASNTREILDHTVKEVRSISHNLMPSVLNDFGLKSALKNMVDSVNGQFTGSLYFDHTGDLTRLESDVEIGIYRIAQEAVNNALKYSKADEISVSLSGNGNCQKLVIKDNGIGFDIDPKKESGGNGLYNMHQRSKLIGCQFNISSKPEKGTEITVTKGLC